MTLDAESGRVGLRSEKQESRVCLSAEGQLGEEPRKLKTGVKRLDGSMDRIGFCGERAIWLLLHLRDRTTGAIRRCRRRKVRTDLYVVCGREAGAGKDTQESSARPAGQHPLTSFPYQPQS